MNSSLKYVINKCQSFIFDLDGVVVETEPLKFAAYQRVFRDAYGIDLPEDDVSWRGKPEKGVVGYWLRCFDLKGNHLELIKRKRRIYKEMLRNTKMEPVSGVESFLQRIRNESKSCALATCSNRSDQIFILSKLGLENAFDVTVTLDDIQSPKPDPEIYFVTAKLLGIAPRFCIVFEDSPPGIEAAVSAGMHCVGLTTSFGPPDLAKASFVVSHFNHIIEMVW